MRHYVLAAVCAAALLGSVGSPVAAADPPPDPALIGPAVDADAPAAPTPPLDPFAAASAQSRVPSDALAGLLGGASPIALANQGVGLAGTPPANLLAATDMLAPQYYRMPSGEANSPYVLQTNVPASPFARLDAFQGVHALAHGGLGRMPGFELGQPLPGTAPPPGTNLPPGLEQFYVEPLPPAAPPADQPAG